MKPGDISIPEFGVNAKARVVSYNGLPYEIFDNSVDCELVVEVTAYRNRRGELEDIEASYNGRRVYLSREDQRAAIDLLADIEPVSADEPDLCEQMGIGLMTIGVGTR